MKFNGVKNLIFDLDGTLIDSSEGITRATNYALNSVNEPERTIGEIKKYIGFPLENMFAAFSDKPFKLLWQYFREKAREVMVDDTVPLDGADEVVRTLSERGFLLSIASTKITPHISGILKKMEWDDLINIYVGADSVENVKPAPDAFLLAMKLMKGNPDNTAVIGDTVNDIIAARKASIPSIAVRSPYGNHEELEQSGPDIMIDQLTELLEIFN